MAKREVKVKEYKDGKDFEKDAQKMVKDGWRIDAQLAHRQGPGIAGRLTFGILAPSRDRITVTWAKGGEDELKRCPHCAEQIQAAAKVCRFCNRDV